MTAYKRLEHSTSATLRKLCLGVVCALTTLIVGCAMADRHDRGALTKFDPLSEYNTYDLWRYEAFAPPTSGYGLTDEGEATRMRWLIERLQMNNLSLVGYEIVDKKIVQVGQGLAGPSYKIIYTVKVPKGSGTVR